MMARVQLNLRIEEKKKQHYQKLAEADGRTLTGWVLRTLDLADPDSNKRQGNKPH